MLKKTPKTKAIYFYWLFINYAIFIQDRVNWPSLFIPKTMVFNCIDLEILFTFMQLNNAWIIVECVDLLIVLLFLVNDLFRCKVLNSM